VNPRRFRFRQIALYLVFGTCSTLINMICYEVLYDLYGVRNVPATILAWLAAVLFSFATNKVFVFKSKRRRLPEQLTEFFSFFGFRILTGLLDVGIMLIAVDMMGWNGLLWKFLSNVVVTISNYLASRFMIFKQ